jgi:hypothetical protein
MAKRQATVEKLGRVGYICHGDPYDGHRFLASISVQRRYFGGAYYRASLDRTDGSLLVA